MRVILADPMDVETVETQFYSQPPDSNNTAPRASILEAINRYYGQFDGESADSMLQEFTDTAIDFTETEDAGDGFDDDDDSNGPIGTAGSFDDFEAVITSFDIHVEPFEDRIRIRYRIDGRLVERDSPPRRLLGAILSCRIKILADMDIAERRRPQDGRIKITASGKTSIYV